MDKPAFLFAVLLLMCGPSNSIAEETSTWSPSQPVRIVVPFQAGGPIYTIARTIAQQLNEKWGRTFIVENRTGAGGNIGMESVAKAPADGYTLGTASGRTHGANATLYGSRLPFDPVKEPNVVPLAEQGLAGFNAVTWFGLVAPSGVPRNIADAYYTQISASLSEPELRGHLLRMGLDPITMPSMEFGRFIAGEVEKWGSVVESVSVHID